jgi:hypothetical protein
LNINNDFGLPEATGKPRILLAELIILCPERLTD